jgi:hypothetical protein
MSMTTSTRLCARARDIPTRLWIDTEFNEFRGELISMALVDDRRIYPHQGTWWAVTSIALAMFVTGRLL